MQLVSPAAKIAGHFAAEQRQNFVEMVGRRHLGIDDDLHLRIHLARFLEEPEGKACANAESVLAIIAAMGEGEFDFLSRGRLPRDVRKKYWPRENLARAFFIFTHHAQGEGRPRLLFIAQLQFSDHGLLREYVLGNVEPQLDAGKHRARQHAGNQDAGERAGQHHEEQVVAGVDGSENQDGDHAEVHHAFAREAVVHLVNDPAQAGTPRELGHDGDAHPSGKAQSDRSADGSECDAALLRDGGGEERDQQRHREYQHGDGEIAPIVFIAVAPESKDERVGHRGYTGTRVVSRISPRMASACSDFFCVET